jgi:phage shock protein A
MLDYIKALDGVLGIIAVVLASAATLHTWLTRPSKANADKIAELQAVNAELHGRISDLETVMKNQPTREDFHALNLQLTQVSGDIATLSANLTAVERIATRIDDFLLNNGGK